ncbi:unnamed protein product [Citrullus colocynthis]|uniref:Uncharacterized protein n=1 Tax=Citrullus colocynthis TaxID=252529 RepID=A0ABP0YLR9_9ROSI
MEINFIIIIFFLFLLATPSFSYSKGGSENGGMESASSSSSSSEVYEIDYRGPETHPSHISPPDHSHGSPWIIHHHHQHQHQFQPKQSSLKPDSYKLKGSKVGA